MCYVSHITLNAFLRWWTSSPFFLLIASLQPSAWRSCMIRTWILYGKIKDTQSSLRNNLIQPNHAQILVLDLESSSMCFYLAYFERLLGQCGILKHCNWSRGIQLYYIMIRTEGAIWFGLIRLISSSFGENFGCICKVKVATFSSSVQEEQGIDDVVGKRLSNPFPARN